MFYYEGTEEVAWRICGCSIPGSVQGQAEWGFGQPGLVAPWQGVGTSGLQRPLPTQTTLFYEICSYEFILLREAWSLNNAHLAWIGDARLQTQLSAAGDPWGLQANSSLKLLVPLSTRLSSVRAR